MNNLPDYNDPSVTKPLGTCCEGKTSVPWSPDGNIINRDYITNIWSGQISNGVSQVFLDTSTSGEKTVSVQVNYKWVCTPENNKKTQTSGPSVPDAQNIVMKVDHLEIYTNNTVQITATPTNYVAWATNGNVVAKAIVDPPNTPTNRFPSAWSFVGGSYSNIVTRYTPQSTTGFTTFIATAGASSVTNTVCPVRVDLDTDSNNNGAIDSNDEGEDKHEEYAPGVIICKDRAGDGANLDAPMAGMGLLLTPSLNSGTLEFSTSGDGGVQIWEDSAKTRPLKTKYNLRTEVYPSFLYVDGVTKGQVYVEAAYHDPEGRKITSDKVAVFVTETISWAPAGKLVCGWEPCQWDGGGGQGIDTPTTVLDNVKDQGWNVRTLRFADASNDDDNVMKCTLANFKRMGQGGLVEISTHGSDKIIAAVYTKTRKAALKWMGDEQDMYCEPAGEVYTVEGTTTNYMWSVRVRKKWIRDNWKPTLDTQKSLTMWMVCHSATGGNSSFIARAGGRTAFGYDSCPAHAAMQANNNKLFGRMNGSLDGTLKRTALETYEGGAGYGANLTMFGNGWTTLCPSPNAVFPAETVGKRKGWGCIIFDTYMDSSIAANQAVTKLSGSCSTTGFRWIENPNGAFAVGFDLDNTAGGGATMRARPGKCLNAPASEGRQLDGNRVKPNGDPKDWPF